MLTSTDARLITGRLAGRRVTVRTLFGRQYTGTVRELEREAFTLSLDDSVLANHTASVRYVDVESITPVAPAAPHTRVLHAADVTPEELRSLRAYLVRREDDRDRPLWRLLSAAEQVLAQEGSVILTTVEHA